MCVCVYLWGLFENVGSVGEVGGQTAGGGGGVGASGTCGGAALRLLTCRTHTDTHKDTAFRGVNRNKILWAINKELKLCISKPKQLLFTKGDLKRT